MTTRICESLAAADAGALLALVARASGADRGADVIELRLDRLADPDALSREDLRRLLSAARRPVVVTARPSWQGGGYGGSEGRRSALLERALDAGAWRVDFELAAPDCRGWMADHADRTLLSHHWETPALDGLSEHVAAIEALRPSMAKLVAPAASELDALPLLGAGRRLRRAGIEAACFCMGAAGRASRMLDAAAGGALIYCHGEATPTAAGQPSTGWVRRELAPQHWRPEGERYGLVGDPVDHSLSPAIFNAAFAFDGTGAGYVPVAAGSLADALRLAEECGLHGLSVTMPFKLQAARMATPAGVAQRIGAVNTLVRTEAGWEGHNTDGPAATAALSAAMPLPGRRVLLLGAGGAARAAAVCLRDAGAQVLVASRRSGPASSLAAQVGGESVAWPEIAACACDAVINATPVGMNATDEVPISTAELPRGCVVMEMIYRPVETAWLRQAKERGHRIVRGVEMFVRQAAAQYRLWTGREAPLGILREVAIERLGQGDGEC